MSNSVISLGELLSDAELFTDGDWVESKDQDEAGSFRLIQLADVGDGFFLNKSARFMNEDAFTRLRCTELKKGDLLIARMPDPLGRACIFPGDQKKCATVVDVCIVRANQKRVDVNWLKHAINSQSVRLQINSYARGATRVRISRKNLANLTVPNIPLALQQRIAAILDKAAEIKAMREQAITKLDELAQSTFVEMFGEQISSSNKTVNDFFEVNVNSYETNLKDADSVAFVPMSAVSEISKAIENEEARTYSEVKKGYTPIKRGDLIVAKITPCYENGKQAIANVSTQFAYGSTEFHTFRSSNKDLVTLLHYYLQTKNVMREGAANMKGAAGQRRVPDSFFKSLPFSLPASNELNKFGAVIASQNKRRAEQIRQLAIIENTIQSLQQQAFTTGFNA